MTIHAKFRVMVCIHPFYHSPLKTQLIRGICIVCDDSRYQDFSFVPNECLSGDFTVDPNGWCDRQANAEDNEALGAFNSEKLARGALCKDFHDAKVISR